MNCFRDYLRLDAFSRDTAAYGGPAWLDIDGDDDLPTLGSPAGAREFLWINQGDGQFEERRFPTRHPLPSFSPAVGDLAEMATSTTS